MVNKYVGIITEKPVELTNLLTKENVAHACIYNNKENGENIYVTVSKIPEGLRKKLNAFKAPERILMNKQQVYKTLETAVSNKEEAKKLLEKQFFNRPSYIETEDQKELGHFILNIKEDTMLTDFFTGELFQTLDEWASTKEWYEALKNGTGVQYLKKKFDEVIENSEMQDPSEV